MDTVNSSAVEDQNYSMVLTALDADPSNDTLTWSYESGPSWLGLNGSTDTLEGTPENGEVGTHQINVSVSDGKGGLSWSRFEITVSNTNDAPVIINSPLQKLSRVRHISSLWRLRM